MNHRIKLRSEYIHPTESIKDHEYLKDFEATITYVKQFDIGTFCLFGETEFNTRLIAISNDESLMIQLPQKQYHLNTHSDLSELNCTQCASFVSCFKRSITPLKNLENEIPQGEPLLQELTRDTFGWILWAWQVMGLISFYIPTVEPTIFINQLHKDNQAAWTLLKEINTASGPTLYELLKAHSLGLRYDTPSYYFANQLHQLILGEPCTE